MRRSLFFTLTLLVFLSTLSTFSRAAESERIMVLPVTPKYLGMDKEVATFTNLQIDWVKSTPS